MTTSGHGKYSAEATRRRADANEAFCCRYQDLGRLYRDGAIGYAEWERLFGEARDARRRALDAIALRQTSTDVSDIDPATRARVAAGFAAAYDRAERITAGTLDPMSGGS